MAKDDYIEKTDHTDNDNDQVVFYFLRASLFFLLFFFLFIKVSLYHVYSSKTARNGVLHYYVSFSFSRSLS